MSCRAFGISIVLSAIASCSVFADYESTVLEDMPFAYFRFEDAAGASELADSSGNGASGYDITDVEFQQDGIVGKAGEFLGSSSIVTDIDFDPSADGLNQWTIETWFYTTGVEEIEDPETGDFIEVVRDQQVYIAQKDGGGLGRSNVLISAQRQPGSFIGGNTTNAFDPATSDFLQPEQWYHFVVAANADEDELYFYVNGEPSELNPQFPGNNGIEPADGEWVIGSHKNQGAQFFEGLLDEIAFYDKILSPERIKAHYDAAMGVAGVPGDYNNNGQRDVADLDLLTAGVAAGDAAFDLNGDGATDNNDRLFWINDLSNTWVGDSNFDGEFSSADFVKVFTSAKYETGAAANWGEGDWNGDGLFSSSDFVQAFAAGSYEQGPRAGGLMVVPEPTSAALSLLGLISLFAWRRK
ncbi:MAG: PEP-CTERM sorting domain-containing protein [Planctomycetales bacterium]|nr:PEP-CTERM sorting domain-containing protein [Planctomycetales bacterium]